MLVKILNQPRYCNAAGFDAAHINPAADLTDPDFGVSQVTLNIHCGIDHAKQGSAGSAILMRVGSANRDHGRFTDGDYFDICRERLPHAALGHGIRACMGLVLARMEGRIVLEEFLRRFPGWEEDLEGARLSPSSAVRGWETLPVAIP